METMIEVFLPGTGGLPENAVDGGGAVFTKWEVGDEAQFTVSLPARHDGGSIGIRIDVIGAVGKSHRWRLRLSKAGSLLSEVNASFVGNGHETTETIEAAAGTSGLESGETLTFSLKRVDALENEDPSAVNLYGARFYAGVSVEAISGCNGRLGKIVDGVLIRFNDTGQKHISENEIVVFANDLIRDLAQRRLFRRSVWLDLSAGQHVLGLTDFGSDVIDVVSLGYQEYAGSHLWQVTAVNEQWDVEKHRNAYGPTRWYHLAQGMIDIAPTPRNGGRLGAVVAFLPNETGCMDGTLPTPNAYDQMFTYWCLRECHGRDWTATGARDQWVRYNGLFEGELTRLMSGSSGNERRVVGTRSLRYYRG